MAMILRQEPADVEQRLLDFGFSVEEFHDIGRAAYVAKHECSPLHPPTFPGTAAWATAVRKLRDLKLMEDGWHYANPGNFSVTLNERGRFFIVVATGDDWAGRTTGREPTTKSPKGFKTEAAVAANRQLSLFPDAIPDAVRLDPQLAGYKAWFLLMKVEEGRVYFELSSPSEMADGKITEWEERIIIPPLILDRDEDTSHDGGRGPGGDFAPDVDVDVQPL